MTLIGSPNQSSESILPSSIHTQHTYIHMHLRHERINGHYRYGRMKRSHHRESLTSLFACKSAPTEYKYFTTGKWPIMAAHIRAVSPSYHHPYTQHIYIHMHLRHERINGHYRYERRKWSHHRESLTSLFACMSAPTERKYFTTGKWPL